MTFSKREPASRRDADDAAAPIPAPPIPAAPIPAAVAELLRAAKGAELSAQGTARRDAYRTSRHLIGGALANGIPADAIAALLTVTPYSVKARGGVNGLVRPDIVTVLTEISDDQLAIWEHNGQLHLCVTEERGAGYIASELLAAITHDQAHTSDFSRETKPGTGHQKYSGK